MAVTLSIRNVPEEVAEALRRRAASHQRSLQGELLALLHEAALTESRLTPQQVLERARALRLRPGPRSVTIVRRERDARARR
jgi:plasmid stability protein